MSNKPCEWCVQTTEQVDGLESALEISEKKLARFQQIEGGPDDPTKLLRAQYNAALESGSVLIAQLEGSKNKNLAITAQLEQANQRIAELESKEVWLVLSEGSEGASHFFGVYRDKEKMREDLARENKDFLYTEPVNLDEMAY